MKAQTAPKISGYTRAIVMVQFGKKWMALDWIAFGTPYSKVA